jgi:recombination protein RecT
MATTDRARAAVARRADQGSGPTLAQYFRSLEPEMARALPKHMPAERMARIALTTVRRDKTGKLGRCTPESFAGALLTAAQLGLEVGNDEAYLVPYSGEVTLIVGYQGYAKLFWQSPLARHLDAQAVHAADFFEYEYGLSPRLVHRPAMVADRGPVVAFYAVAALSTGGSAFVVLSPEQVKALRATSKRPDVRDPMMWMERKTALRQLFKLLPKSAELNAALAADDQVRTDLTENVVESASYIDAEPPAAIEQVDPQTGEIPPPPDPDEPLWGEVAQPGSGIPADRPGGGS